jgi:WD40 repeat protein
MLEKWLTKKQILMLRGAIGMLLVGQIGAFVWVNYHDQNICKLSQPHSPYCDLTIAQTLTGESVEGIALSADGRTLVGGGGKTITVWHLPNQKPQYTLQGYANDNNDIALSADGQTMVSLGSSDNTIKVWNLATGKLKFKLKGHSEVVKAIVMTPDGQTIVSASLTRRLNSGI